MHPKGPESTAKSGSLQTGPVEHLSKKLPAPASAGVKSVVKKD